jgi:hypothetical protein
LPVRLLQADFGRKVTRNYGHPQKERVKKMISVLSVTETGDIRKFTQTGLYIWTHAELKQTQLAWDIPEWTTPPEGVPVFSEREQGLLDMQLKVLHPEVMNFVWKAYNDGLQDGEQTTRAGLYQLVPHFTARNPELSVYEVRALLVVGSHSWGKNWCWASVGTLSTEARMSERKFQYCLRSLTENDYLWERPPTDPKNTKELPEYKPTSKMWGIHKFTPEETRQFGIEKHYS